MRRLNGQHAGLTRESIVEAAIGLVGRRGASALTTSDVARTLGVSQPALYSHFSNFQSLLAAVTYRANELLGERLLTAITSDADRPVEAFLHAYRDYVREYPDLYLLQARGTRDPDPDTAETQQDRAATVGKVAATALRLFGMTPNQASRCQFSFRAAIHGFASLEARARAIGSEHSTAESRAAQGWDPDDNRSFEVFVELLVAGLVSIREGKARRFTSRRRTGLATG